MINTVYKKSDFSLFSLGNKAYINLPGGCVVATKPVVTDVRVNSTVAADRAGVFGGKDIIFDKPVEHSIDITLACSELDSVYSTMTETDILKEAENKSLLKALYNKI